MGIHIDEVTMNPKMKKLQVSKLRAFHDQIKEYEHVIDFTLGDAQEDVHEQVFQATVDSLKRKETHYTDKQGLDELRIALSEREIHYNKDEFLITSGATQGLFEVLMTLLSPKDGLMVGIPAYPSYVSLAILFDLDLQAFLLDEQFQLNEDELEKRCQSNTKAILINYPHNPSGALLNEDSIRLLRRFVCKHNLILIWDAAYYECGSYPTLYHEMLHGQMVQIHSFSKYAQMCGYRIGYVCAPIKWIVALTHVHQLNQVCLPAFIQYGALEALKHSHPIYDRQKAYLIQRLKDMKLQVVDNQGPYYVFFSIRKFKVSSEFFATTLLKEFGVAVLPGKYFYLEWHIRMSCCIDLVKCKEGCDRLEAFVKLL